MFIFLMMYYSNINNSTLTSPLEHGNSLKREKEMKEKFKREKNERCGGNGNKEEEKM